MHTSCVGRAIVHEARKRGREDCAYAPVGEGHPAVRSVNRWNARRYACSMNKAFTREADGDEDDEEAALPQIPAGTKNYITPQGYARLRAELLQLIDDERPKVVDVVKLVTPSGAHEIEVVAVKYPAT